jgi:transcriptional regulator with XRE-family HTH domain
VVSVRGQAIRDAREDLGWSRRELVELLDPAVKITSGKLTYIETGHREPTEEEVAELERILRRKLSEVLAASSEQPAVEEDAGELRVNLTYNGRPAVRSFAWRGLKRGDLCRVRGVRGRFKFMFHHQDVLR